MGNMRNKYNRNKLPSDMLKYYNWFSWNSVFPPSDVLPAPENKICRTVICSVREQMCLLERFISFHEATGNAVMTQCVVAVVCFFFLSNKQTKQIDGDSAHTFSLSLYLSLPLYLGLLCCAKIVYWTFSEFLNKSVQKQSSFCFILFCVCFLFCLVLHFVVGLFAFCFIMHWFFLFFCLFD